MAAYASRATEAGSAPAGGTTGARQREGTAPDAQPPWRVLPIILTPVSMMTFDLFGVNVALPPIQGMFHTSPATIELVISGFSLTVAAGLIAATRLGDLFDRRRIFAIGVALFTAASAACGLALNADVLVSARIAQGLGGALMLPQALAYLGLLFNGKNRAKAFGCYGLTIGLSGAFSQPIGGALINADIAGSDWRPIFLLNVPVGLVVLALLPRIAPMTRPKHVPRLDLIGTLLACSGLIAVVVALVEGRQQHWPLWTLLCLAFALPLFLAFLGHQRRLRSQGIAPLVSLDIFRDQKSSVGLIIAFIHYAVMTSFLLIFALYLQQGRHLDPLQSGLIFLPAGAGFFTAWITASAMIKRLGWQAVAVGALAVCVGYALLILGVYEIGLNGSDAWIMPGLLVAGYGMGTVMSSLGPMVLKNTSTQEMTAASALLATVMQMGSAVGVPAAAIIFYGTLGSAQSAFRHAFVVSMLTLILFTLTVAFLAQFLSATISARAAAHEVGSGQVVWPSRLQGGPWLTSEVIDTVQAAWERGQQNSQATASEMRRSHERRRRRN